LGKANPRQN